MIRKLTLAAGFGAGYLLGAKAGKERYTQIEAQVRELLGRPAVQEFTSKAGSTVTEKVAPVSDRGSSPDDDSASIGASGTKTGTFGTKTSSAPASIDEMSDLELDLATTPTPPSGTAATKPGPARSAATTAPLTPTGEPGTVKVEVERGL